MKKNILTVVIAILTLTIFSTNSINAQVNKQDKNSNKNNIAAEPADETTLLWGTILNDNVSADGVVNYRKFEVDTRFDKLYNDYSQIVPMDKWTDNRAKTFWINLYNINVVKLVLDNYPINSINDLDKPFDNKFINVGGAFYSLNDIENNILRKQFDDPRIHFAINCAAYSCPKLSNAAFVPETVDQMLNKAAYAYVNNPNHNKISADKIQISQIFEWFESDFIKSEKLIDFLNKYSSTEIKADAKISYIEYNWALNQ